MSIIMWKWIPETYGQIKTMSAKNTSVFSAKSVFKTKENLE